MVELASDTIFDILSRLPAKSLARFRCVSKPWCANIDDDYFGIIHGKRAVEELTPIMYDPRLSCITGFNITKSEEGNTILEAKKVMSVEHRTNCVALFSKYRTNIVGGSCNGLLYLSLRSIPCTSSLAVIHPLRKELHVLPPMQLRLDGPYRLVEESRGLCFDVSTHTFKMVCVLWRRDASRSGTFDSINKNLCTMVHVLGMDSSWRKIPQVPPYPTYGDGIFAHGCLYWLVSYQDSWQSNSYKEIICFDARNEEFTLIYPPTKRCDYSVFYHLVDLNGEVGYAYLYNTIEVWVLKQNQWANHCQFNIKQSFGSVSYFKVLGRWNKDGDILILTRVKKLLVYRLNSRLLEEVNIVGQEYGPNSYMYMYPASSMFSVRGINKTAHSIKTDLKQLD